MKAAIIRLHSLKNGLFLISQHSLDILSKVTKSIIIKLKQLLETNILLSFYYDVNKMYLIINNHKSLFLWNVLGRTLSHAIIKSNHYYVSKYILINDKINSHPTFF